MNCGVDKCADLDADRLPLLSGEATDGEDSTAAVMKYHI